MTAPAPLRRTSGLPLRLTRAHDRLVHASQIEWSSFDRSLYKDTEQVDAAAAWSERVVTETHSLGVFTRLAAEVQALGAPLDWSGALARVVGDEVRHVDLALRLLECVDPAARVAIAPAELELPLRSGSPRAQTRYAITATLCVGETISLRCLRRCFEVADVPVARSVVRVLLTDETLHAQLGWELAALLARAGEHPAPDAPAPTTPDERDLLAAALPDLFAYYRDASGAGRGAKWAFAHPDIEDNAANFGTLTAAGYARCFYEAMREDIVPQLVAIGFPEAKRALEAIL